MKNENPTPRAGAVAKITVELTEQQLRLFHVLALSMGAKPGEVILGLACDRLNSNPCGSDAYADMAEMLWDYVKRGLVPPAVDWLDETEKRTLAHPGPIEKLLTAPSGLVGKVA